MRDPPPHVLWAHRIFNLSVVIAALFGLVAVWFPFESAVAVRLIQSDFIVLGASMFLLAAHRTVYWRPRGEILGPH